MSNGGHVGWSALRSQAHEVVMEDDIHDPVRPVFDAPIGADGECELRHCLLGRGKVLSEGNRGGAVALDARLDHAERGKARKRG